MLFSIFLFILSCFQASAANTFYVNLDKCNDTLSYCRVANKTDTFYDIQYALNFMSNKGGGDVVLQAGTYIIGYNIDMYKATRLYGQGIDKTYIKLKDYAPPFSNAGLLRATMQSTRGCNYIVISNLTLDGNKNKQYTDYVHIYGRFGIFTEVCHNITLDGVRTINFQGYGFDPHGMKPTSFAYNLTIINSISNDNDWDGFTIDQSINVLVENCTAFNNGRHGFNIVTASKFVTLNNITTRNNGFFYYTKDPGCGIAMQINKGFETQILMGHNAYLLYDNKGGFCTTGNVSAIVLSNMTIYNSNRCIHLSPNVSNVSLSFINCWNARRFVMYKDVFNLTAFNNTLNGTIVDSIPKATCAC